MATTTFVTVFMVLLVSITGGNAAFDVDFDGSAPALPQPMIWPLPASYDYGSSVLVLSQTFNITLGSGSFTSKALDKAMDNYMKLIFSHPKADGDANGLQLLNVFVSSSNTTLQLGFDESYTLTVDESSTAVLKANTVYGAIRGLETFAQLVQYNFTGNVYYIANAPWTIADQPRFSHRGLLLDTSRHFQPVSVIIQVLESMAYAKLNVFHWHIVDAQSFPLQIKAYPLLWNGAWSPSQRYSQADVEYVVNKAEELGIRVIPEFDGPGHAYAWGIGYPELLPAGFNTLNTSVCLNECPPQYGNPCDVPLDPTNNFTYSVLKSLLHEVTGGQMGHGMFPDNFVHLGGDEVDEGCWSASPSIAAFMQKNNLTYDGLYGYYITKAHNIAFEYQRSPVNWEEVFNYFGTALDPRTVIHVWLDFNTLAQVVASGYRGILSNNDAWYLDHLSTNWTVFYQNEPFTQITDPTQQSLVLGGEVCMWGETVDASDVLQTIWPRAAAAAERLWSPESSLNDMDSAFVRLENFRCTLNERGIPAAPTTADGRGAPVGPGSCYLQ